MCCFKNIVTELLLGLIRRLLSFVFFWVPFERERVGPLCSIGNTGSVFISESDYWSSTADASSSHSDTLMIHPLRSACIRAGLLRTLFEQFTMKDKGGESAEEQAHASTADNHEQKSQGSLKAVQHNGTNYWQLGGNVREHCNSRTVDPFR